MPFQKAPIAGAYKVHPTFEKSCYFSWERWAKWKGARIVSSILHLVKILLYNSFQCAIFVTKKKYPSEGEQARSADVDVFTVQFGVVAVAEMGRR